MAFKHTPVTVGVEATDLLAGVPDTQDFSSRSILIQNPVTSVALYLGGEGVTAEDYGYVVAPGGEFATSLENGERLYGAVDVDTTDFRILHSGV